MKILNVEYLNQAELLPEWLLDLMLIVMTIALILALIISATYQDFKPRIRWVLIPWVISITLFCFILKAEWTKTPYIKSKEVIFTEDAIPIEVIKDYDIKESRGEIFILTPRTRERDN